MSKVVGRGITFEFESGIFSSNFDDGYVSTDCAQDVLLANPMGVSHVLHKVKVICTMTHNQSVE